MLQAVASAISLAVSAAELVGAIAIACVVVTQAIDTVLSVLRKLGGK